MAHNKELKNPVDYYTHPTTLSGLVITRFGDRTYDEADANDR
ncbi:MAG: hypothetical protein WA667_10375 [Candidatus Nitrosopolaris sp.]